MWQKLTYGGTTCNNYLYFAFYSEEFDTDAVTSELKIDPTSVTKKKDPVPRSTTWKFEIVAGEDIDLVSPLTTLMDLFEPKIQIIKNLKRDLKLETRLQF